AGAVGVGSLPSRALGREGAARALARLREPRGGAPRAGVLPANPVSVPGLLTERLHDLFERLPARADFLEGQAREGLAGRPEELRKRGLGGVDVEDSRENLLLPVAFVDRLEGLLLVGRVVVAAHSPELENAPVGEGHFFRVS